MNPQWLLTTDFPVKDSENEVVFTTTGRGVLTFVDLYPSSPFPHMCVYLYEEPERGYHRCFWRSLPPGKKLYDLETLP